MSCLPWIIETFHKDSLQAMNVLCRKPCLPSQLCVGIKICVHVRRAEPVKNAHWDLSCLKAPSLIQWGEITSLQLSFLFLPFAALIPNLITETDLLYSDSQICFIVLLLKILIQKTFLLPQKRQLLKEIFGLANLSSSYHAGHGRRNHMKIQKV